MLLGGSDRTTVSARACGMLDKGVDRSVNCCVIYIN